MDFEGPSPAPRRLSEGTHVTSTLQRTADALRESEERLRAFVDATSDAVFRMSPDWAGLRQLRGRNVLPDCDEPIEDWLDAYLPKEDQAAVLRAIDEGVARKAPFELEHRYRRPDGALGWALSRAVPMLDEEGEVTEWVGTATDVTERKRTEEAVWQSREDFNRAQSVGQIGSWRLDVGQDVLSWSDETYRTFGLTIGTPLTYEVFLSLVHSEDRRFVDAQWQAAIRGEPYDIEHRLLVEGEVRWVREKAFLEYGEGGELLAGFGIAQDVTERKAVEEALRESEERYRTIVELADEDLTVATDGTYSFRESVADGAHEQRRQLRAWPIALAARVQRHRLRCLLVAIALELALLIPLGLLPTSRHVLGMPG